MSQEVVSWRVESKGLAEEYGGLSALQERRIGTSGERPRSRKIIEHRERGALRFSCESYDFGKLNRARAQSSSFRGEVSEWHFAVDICIVLYNRVIHENADFKYPAKS